MPVWDWKTPSSLQRGVQEEVGIFCKGTIPRKLKAKQKIRENRWIAARVGPVGPVTKVWPQRGPLQQHFLGARPWLPQCSPLCRLLFLPGAALQRGCGVSNCSWRLVSNSYSWAPDGSSRNTVIKEKGGGQGKRKGSRGPGRGKGLQSPGQGFP